MAYCRWSTDLGRCDIYAYADDAGGYTVHVALQKRIIPDDWIDPLEGFRAGTPSAKEWAERTAAIYRDMSNRRFVDIDAPSAGKSFNVPTLEDLQVLLLSLRDEGLRFPDYVLAWIDDEIREARR